ncbi:MAG TPA: hypothetical protein VGD94_09215 [Vicinamibacterales bacterium]
MANEDGIVPVNGAERRDVNGVRVEMTRVGEGRVRRVIYPAGFRWSRDMKPTVGTDRCMHTHVGFIIEGAIGVEFADGCRRTFTAPEAVSIEAGHEGWVASDGPAVMIEFDFEGDTANRFGISASHQHR